MTTAVSNHFDSTKPVPGELNYLGRDTADLQFSFDEVVQGIASLDGDERCGLHFQLAAELSDEELASVCADDTRRKDVRPIRMTSDTFCLGGGAATGYVCHIYTENGPVWLTSQRGDPDEIREIVYDCGCDTNLGIFPGNYVLSFEEVVEAARHFFRTGKMTDKFVWANQDDLGFDPWYV